MIRRIGSRYRWMVASRVLAAVLGGYVLTSLFTAVLALLMLRLADYPTNEAKLIAMMWSFAVYAAVAIWVFAVRSAKLAWAGLALGMVIFGLVLFWLKGGV